MAEAQACRVCGSDASDPTAFGGLIRRCAACSFAWTSTPIAPPADLHDDSYFRGGGYEDYFQPAARRFEAGQRMRWLLSIAHPATVLEVGCAAGFFVEAATRAGLAARGIEIAEGPARYARDELGLDVVVGAFESAGVSEPVDAVCAFHVLEHAEDPHRFVDAARRVLHPGGLLVLEVPNIGSASACRLGASWPHLQPQYHRWHFTPESLTRLVSAHGFEIVARDTVVLRFYMPPRFRRRQARHLVAADVRDLHTFRLSDPARGDLLRLVARRPSSIGAS